MTSQHSLNKLIAQIKPFSKLYISPKYAKVVYKVIEPDLRLNLYSNDEYLDKIKKSLNERGIRNGLDKNIDLKKFKCNAKELLNSREQLREYLEDESKKELIQDIREKIYDLEEKVIPILLRLPNLFDETEVPTDGFEDEILKQTKPRYYNFKILDAKRISYINDLRKSSILGPHCEYLLGKGALISLALQKYFRESIKQKFPEKTGKGFVKRHLHEVDGLDLVKSALIEATNDYDELNYENDALQIDSKANQNQQQLHLCGSCSRENFLSLLIKRQTKSKYLPARFIQFGSSYDQNAKQVNAVFMFSLIENDYEKSNKEFKTIEELIWDLYKPFNLPIRLRRSNVKRLNYTEFNRVDLDIYFPYSREWKPMANYSHHSDYLATKVHCTDHHTLGGKLTNLNLLLDAILENHQTETGKIEIPDCLVNFM